MCTCFAMLTSERRQLAFFKRNLSNNTNNSNQVPKNKLEDLTHIKSSKETNHGPKIFENVKNEIKSNKENITNDNKNNLYRKNPNFESEEVKSKDRFNFEIDNDVNKFIPFVRFFI